MPRPRDRTREEWLELHAHTVSANEAAERFQISEESIRRTVRMLNKEGACIRFRAKNAKKDKQEPKLDGCMAVFL